MQKAAGLQSWSLWSLVGYLVLVVLEHSVEGVLCSTDHTQRAVHHSLLL